MTELAEALKISAQFKKAVNDCYKLLEIDLDGIFKRLLLLQKKKYAAVKVEDSNRTSTEVKGLDMKRREYCALSKTVSQYVQRSWYGACWLMSAADTYSSRSSLARLLRPLWRTSTSI